MNEHDIDQIILNTLENDDLSLDITTISELKDLLIIPHNKKITEKDYMSSINRLVKSKKIYIQNDFISNDIDKFNDNLQSYLKYKKELNRVLNTTKNDFAILFNKFDIKLVCFDALLFQKDYYGKDATRKRVHIYILTGSNNKGFTFSLLTKLIKLKQRKLIYEIIDFDGELNFETFVKEKNIKNAYHIINIKPIFNKDSAYEKFVYKNMWVFDIFKNYPMKKISYGYKI